MILPSRACAPNPCQLWVPRGSCSALRQGSDWKDLKAVAAGHQQGAPRGCFSGINVHICTVCGLHTALLHLKPHSGGDTAEGDMDSKAKTQNTRLPGEKV